MLLLLTNIWIVKVWKFINLNTFIKNKTKLCLIFFCNLEIMQCNWHDLTLFTIGWKWNIAVSSESLTFYRPMFPFGNIKFNFHFIIKFYEYRFEKIMSYSKKMTCDLIFWNKNYISIIKGELHKKIIKMLYFIIYHQN